MPYVPLRDVREQLFKKLHEGVQPDYITLSGSGEPTLHSEIGKLIETIQEKTSIPVAVLTNGSLFWDENLRKDLLRADAVIPSLDAGDEALFQTINRPHPALAFERMVEGLVEFRNLYCGKLWLEVFLLNQINTTREALDHIREQAERIRPDRIQLNTVVRPPAEEWAAPVPDEDMKRICGYFGNAEVIIPYHKHERPDEMGQTPEDILALLRRRPCTLDDICNGLGIHRNEALKYLQILHERDLLRQVMRDGALYYYAPAKG
jgi:wyosine [tRNA(Phe)-imidazoG37] synthetase (radical SAM superfamily)